MLAGIVFVATGDCDIDPDRDVAVLPFFHSGGFRRRHYRLIA
ncbi:hypothetical protein ACFW2Y_16730 [Streptomyces sp. NPDC058877]